MSITIQDLASVVQIIDLAATRGTFKGEELLPVGSVREKFAQAVVAAQKAAEEAEAAPSFPEEVAEHLV